MERWIVGVLTEQLRIEDPPSLGSFRRRWEALARQDGAASEDPPSLGGSGAASG